jgi:hypothetical protein
MGPGTVMLLTPCNRGAAGISLGCEEGSRTEVWQRSWAGEPTPKHCTRPASLPQCHGAGDTVRLPPCISTHHAAAARRVPHTHTLPVNLALVASMPATPAKA